MSRICKACGKEFEPVGREQYCKGPHYLPCPICGKDVEIKYWTDGPKRCNDCRRAKSKMIPKADVEIHAVSSIPVTEPEERNESQIDLSLQDETRSVDISESNVRKYIGAERKGSFIPGHLYLLNIEKEVKYGCYIVTSSSDITSGEDVSLYMRYSNMKTVERNFELVTDQ